MMSKPMCTMLILLLLGSAPSGSDAGSLDLGDLFGRSNNVHRRLAKDELAIPVDQSSRRESQQPSPPVAVSSVRDGKDHMLTVTRDNFHTTVMKEDSPVEHWIVKFCVDSWQCRKLSDIYKDLSISSQKSLNFNLAAKLPIRFANMVRFAEVDCSIERQLCIDQGIEILPSVAHFHRKDLAMGSSKISAKQMWSGEVQSFAPWLENKLKGKVKNSAEPKAASDSVKLAAAEPAPVKPPNAWEQATAELAEMMQDFDDFLDKQEVPRPAVYTVLLALSVALVGSLWRFGWFLPSPPLAPEESLRDARVSAPSHAATQQPAQQELRRVLRPEPAASSTPGSMEL